MAQTKPLVVAGIPALNEEATIARVVIGAGQSVDRVIVCDDGSQDMTGEIAKRLGALVIKHESNLGKGAALRSIFGKARELGASALVTIDGDGQHNPAEIPRLLEGLAAGVDVVVGSRFISNSANIPSHRRAGNVVLNYLTEGKHAGVSDTQSGFRAYGRRAIEIISPGERGMSVDSEILMEARDAGLKIAEVPISVSYEGKTSKTHPVYHGLDVVGSILKLASIRHPLLFYGIPGLVIFLVGLGFSFMTLQYFTQYQTIETNMALAAVATTFMGLLAMFTGIILYTISTVVRKRD